MNLAPHTYLDALSAPVDLLLDPSAWVSNMMEMDTDETYDWVLLFPYTLSYHPSLFGLCLNEYKIIPVFAVRLIFGLESRFN